jgi:hypothetical protein
MAIQSKETLSLLSTSWKGKPFVQVEVKTLNTQRLDVAWMGRPFVGATSGSAAVFPAHRMFLLF